MIREYAEINWFDGKHICRGVPFNLIFTRKDFPILSKLSKGTAQPKEFWALLDHQGHTGVHWWLMDRSKDVDGISSWESPEEYAYGEDTWDSHFGKEGVEAVRTGRYEDSSICLPVIMIAKKPEGLLLSDWDSSLNNKIKSLELEALRYRVSKNNWAIKPFRRIVKK